MTSTTVPTPETTSQPDTKRADQLQHGDWLANGFGLTKPPVKILSAYPFNDEERQFVLVVFTATHGTPLTDTIEADRMMTLASEQDVEAAKVAAYRQAAATQLAHIADLFVIHDGLPLPWQATGLHVDINCDTVAEVQRAGELLGVEPETTGRTTVMTTVRYPPAPAGTPSYRHEPAASITWRSYAQPAPVAEVPVEKPTDPADTGLDFTEPDRLAEPAATAVPAGVDGRKVGGRANFKARKP